MKESEVLALEADLEKRLEALRLVKKMIAEKKNPEKDHNEPAKTPVNKGGHGGRRKVGRRAKQKKVAATKKKSAPVQSALGEASGKMTHREAVIWAMKNIQKDWVATELKAFLDQKAPQKKISMPTVSNVIWKLKDIGKAESLFEKVGTAPGDIPIYRYIGG